MRVVLLLLLLGYVAPDSFFEKYNLIERFAAGGFGEVWHAQENKIGSNQTYVVKRIFTEKGRGVYSSGLREIHFGEVLESAQHISKFIEHHEENGTLWLVFADGGTSLQKLLYVIEQGTRVVPSPLQRYLVSPAGKTLLKDIMRQIFVAVQEIHDMDITHRDLKPDNIVASSHSSQLLEGAIDIKLIDFGSAIDDYSMKELYDSGPSQGDLTFDYEPPESLFDDLPFDKKNPSSYDIWSVGVIFLEMILGASKVFQTDSKSAAFISMMTQQSNDPKLTQRAILFKALSDYCIYKPKIMAPFLFKHLKINETNCKHGTIRLPPEIEVDRWTRSLLQWLLKWKPEERISAKKALSHAFFREEGGYKCGYCGKEFEFEEFLYYHSTTHHDPIPSDYSSDDTRYQRGFLLLSGVELDLIKMPTIRETLKQLLSGSELEQYVNTNDIIPFEVFEEDRRQYLSDV